MRIPRCVGPRTLLFFLGETGENIKGSKDQRINRPPKAAVKGSARRRRQLKGSTDHRRRHKGSSRRRRKTKEQSAAGGPKDRSKTVSKDQSVTNDHNRLKRYYPVEKYVFSKTMKKEALCVFEKLSYSGKKHYVFWKISDSKDQNSPPLLRFPRKKNNNELKYCSRIIIVARMVSQR